MVILAHVSVTGFNLLSFVDIKYFLKGELSKIAQKPENLVGLFYNSESAVKRSHFHSGGSVFDMKSHFANHANSIDTSV